MDLHDLPSQNSLYSDTTFNLQERVDSLSLMLDSKIRDLHCGKFPHEEVSKAYTNICYQLYQRYSFCRSFYMSIADLEESTFFSLYACDIKKCGDVKPLNEVVRRSLSTRAEEICSEEDLKHGEIAGIVKRIEEIKRSILYVDDQIREKCLEREVIRRFFDSVSSRIEETGRGVYFSIDSSMNLILLD